MKLHDASFNEMVGRLKSGELTRAQAATVYGLNPGTLGVWLSRAGLTGQLPSLQGKVGRAAEIAQTDPVLIAAMDAAVAKVVGGEISALEAARQDPRLSARTIAHKVRQFRQRQGLPVQAKRTRSPSAKEAATG